MCTAALVASLCSHFLLSGMIQVRCGWQLVDFCAFLHHPRLCHRLSRQCVSRCRFYPKHANSLGISTHTQTHTHTDTRAHTHTQQELLVLVTLLAFAYKNILQ